MNCPNCGAVIKEGKFCNYCGAKLPDDTKRVEVNINKRIEDVAEMKRADYETAESKYRQQQMKEALLGKKIRRWACLILLILLAGVLVFGLLSKPEKGGISLLVLEGAFGGIMILAYIIYLMITGKW